MVASYWRLQRYELDFKHHPLSPFGELDVTRNLTDPIMLALQDSRNSCIIHPWLSNFRRINESRLQIRGKCNWTLVKPLAVTAYVILSQENQPHSNSPTLLKIQPTRGLVHIFAASVLNPIGAEGTLGLVWHDGLESLQLPDLVRLCLASYQSKFRSHSFRAVWRALAVMRSDHRHYTYAFGIP